MFRETFSMGKCVLPYYTARWPSFSSGRLFLQEQLFCEIRSFPGG